jgi:phage baseplate assembly protein W
MSTFKYPVQAANGSLVLSSNYVGEAIISAIQTKHGERVFRNRYGNSVEELSVTNDLSTTLTQMTEAVIDSTYEYQPLSLSISGYIGDDGLAIIDVEYEDDQRLQNFTINLS